MKLRCAILIGSLLLNGGLVAKLSTKSSIVFEVVSRLRDQSATDFNKKHGGPAIDKADKADSLAIDAESFPSWAILYSDDLNALVARLRTAGFPAPVVRAIITTLVSARYDAQLRALSEPDPKTPFWKLPPNRFAGASSKNGGEILRLKRERSQLLRDLFSDDFFYTEAVTAAQQRRFGDLSRKQVEMVERIEKDYADMASAVRASMNGILLPEDAEKLSLLASEMQADLAATLTSEQLADYAVRTSPLTVLIGRKLGGFDASDAEFRAIFEAQKANREKDFQGQEATQTAAQALRDRLKSALGEFRYNDYVRETDPEFQEVTRLSMQANLSRETAIRAYGVRDYISERSGQIVEDPSLALGDKRVALQALAQDARGRLLATLGTSAGSAYVKMLDSSWLRQVENGNAVTFCGPGSRVEVTTLSGTASCVFGNSPMYRNVMPPNL